MVIQLCLLPGLFFLPNTNHILIQIGQILLLLVQYDNIKNDGYKHKKGYFFQTKKGGASAINTFNFTQIFMTLFFSVIFYLNGEGLFYILLYIFGFAFLPLLLEAIYFCIKDN